MYKLSELKDKPAATAFVITVLLFVFSYLVWGWYTDSYQNLIDYTFSGNFTDYSDVKGSPFPEYMGGLTEILPALNRWYPARWMAYLLQGILFCSMWAIFNLILHEMKGCTLVQTGGVILLVAAFFMESIALYHMVRVAMFSGIAGMLFVYTKQFNENSFFNREGLLYLLLFTIGCWIRFNVLLFVLAFATLVYIIHGKRLKGLLVYMSVFLFFSLYNSTFLHPNRMQTLHFYFTYDAEFKLLFAGEFLPDVKLSNHADSIKFEAIKHEFFADEKNLGRDFYEHIGIFSSFKRWSPYTLQYAISTFKDAMQHNIYYLLADVLLLVMYLAGRNTKMKFFRLKTLFLFGAFYAMIFGICFLKMENRFLVPLQIFFLLIMLMVHRPAVFFDAQKKKYLLLMLAYCVPATFYYTHAKVNTEAIANSNYTRAFDAMAKQYGQSVFVQQDIMMYREKPYQSFAYAKAFKGFYLYNNRTFSVSPSYQPYLEQMCRCSAGDFAPFYDYLYNLDAPVVFVDRPARIAMLQKYLQHIHGRTYSFVQLPLDSATDNLLQSIAEMGERQALFTFNKDTVNTAPLNP